MRKDGKPYELERDEAIRLHLEMWTDMQKKLGDKPSRKKRVEYKHRWLESYGYERVKGSCFLCEYACQVWNFNGAHLFENDCDYCPIDWSSLSRCGINRCCDLYKHGDDDIYLCAPISEILALPEKES